VTTHDILWALHHFPVRWATRRLPPSYLALSDAAADVLGRAAAVPMRRRAAHRFADHLGVSPAEAKALARRHVDHQLRRLRFERRLHCHPPRALPPACVVDGESHLDAALTGRRGVLLFGLHRFAVAEALLALRARKVPVLVVRSDRVRAAHGRLASRWIAPRLGAMLDLTFPDRLSPEQPDAALTITRRLRDNGIVYITPDGGTTRRVASVPVGRSQWLLRVGLLDLARLAGAVLLPTDFLYDGGCVRVIIDGAVPTPTSRDSATKAAHFEEVGAALERQLHRAPDQWALASFKPPTRA
jgi:lauroyl/myristoyl acyltransferase